MPLPLSATATPTATVSPTASLQRLDCYRVARDFARLAQRLPITNAVLRDQFRRASISVLTNTAEGAGRVAKADKRRCYAIARGEACESAALLELVDDAPKEIGELLSRVIAMLTKLVR
ncbi:MAG: four helix bundle protein [Deltaproteobacteria bacterium]|nr:four helix bundle protein [Deltaproteobacteria bacterium]